MDYINYVIKYFGCFLKEFTNIYIDFLLGWGSRSPYNIEKLEPIILLMYQYFARD